MSVQKVGNGYRVDIYPAGRFGPRVRRTFKTKREADFFMHQQKTAAAAPDYVVPRKDCRRLSDIANRWFELFGFELVTGAKRLQIMHSTIRALGDPVASTLKPDLFLRYRADRLACGVSANHLNHELTYLKTMFNKLMAVDQWRQKNPLERLDNLKFKKRQMSFLSREQLAELLSAMEDSRNPDVMAITRICLATGCRWGEAQNLEARHFRAGKIEFIDTKNGENRSVPVTDLLRMRILRDRPRSGLLFRPSWEAFNQALERAGIDLPKGQKTHVLRHTFASHFMMAGGNILELKEILGHKTLNMTMVYAQFSPQHMESAVQINPLSYL